MPKRLNPFVDDVSHQYKMHVRQKDVDLGVNRDENMKEVYDKTLKLLFRGASSLSKSQNGVAEGNLQEIATNGIAQHNGCASTSNDCVSTSNGCVSTSNGITGQVNGNRRTVQMLDCCKRNSRHKCSFCEKCICVDCQRICLMCNDVFCFMCSILQYIEKDEVALCLLCLRA